MAQEQDFNANTSIISEMRTIWQAEYGTRPAVAARAPGRVNLIGEHIDYEGFAVLPMALAGRYTNCMLLDTNTGLIRMKNTNSQFPPSEVPLQPIDTLSGVGWARFVEASIKKFLLTHPSNLNGVDILFSSTLPISSGLASSAALICSVIVGLDLLLDLHLSPQELVNIAHQSEHFAGFMTGLMDHSISILGRRGYACLLSFSPFRANHVKLPPSKIVVAHCGTGNSKIDSSINCYNQRVEEVTKCAELLAGVKTLQQVVEKLGPNQALEQAKLLPERDGDLVLRDRAVHVLTEANRVQLMCTSGFKQWGTLMLESHESCRDLYDCSCEPLNALVEAGIKSGAAGGRLTGQGWGGCCIFLLPPKCDTEKFIASLIREFYTPRNIENPIVFATAPGSGASAIKLN